VEANQPGSSGGNWCRGRDPDFLSCGFHAACGVLSLEPRTDESDHDGLIVGTSGSVWGHGRRKRATQKMAARAGQSRPEPARAVYLRRGLSRGHPG
jgi:hypothetical protein